MYLTYVAFVCRFTLHIPENLEMKSTAPLLCAGITTYSPLMHYGLNKPGMKIGVIGLGGLGHMAVKIAKAMGVEVSVYCEALCGWLRLCQLFSYLCPICLCHACQPQKAKLNSQSCVLLAVVTNR